MPAPHREGVSTWPAPYRRTGPRKTPVGPPTVWRRDAACQDSGEEFVDVTSGQGQKLADTYCIECPVMVQCADYGRATRAYGVWGGDVIEDGRRVTARPVGRPLGTCDDCGHPVGPDTVRCAPCHYRHLASLARAPRNAKSSCSDCGRSIAHTSVRCAPCHRRMRRAVAVS